MPNSGVLSSLWKNCVQATDKFCTSWVQTTALTHRLYANRLWLGVNIAVMRSLCAVFTSLLPQPLTAHLYLFYCRLYTLPTALIKTTTIYMYISKLIVIPNRKGSLA